MTNERLTQEELSRVEERMTQGEIIDALPDVSFEELIPILHDHADAVRELLNE